jgi:hypothetical protein
MEDDFTDVDDAIRYQPRSSTKRFNSHSRFWLCDRTHIRRRCNCVRVRAGRGGESRVNKESRELQLMAVDTQTIDEREMHTQFG